MIFWLASSPKAAMSSSGAVSKIDEIYHETLEKFLKNADDLEMEIKSIMFHDFRMFKFICWSLIAFCIFLFIILGYAFYRYERLRQANYSEIMQMERLLVQSEKMAALGTMITGIAHEINNPNTFISFNIPILKEYLQELIPIVDEYAQKNPDFNISNMSYQEFREDFHKLLENIENGSIRINRIVSDLKTFSQKKDKIKRDWFNISQVVERAVTICGSKIKSLVNSFEIDVSKDLPSVYCDSEVVELILINFLVNAVEASDKRGGWIKLKGFLDEKKQGAVVIEVRDNGSGITKSNMERIFDPFFSTKSSKGGTGMGLYLCRTLADQMGARIEVDSEVDKGSSFRLITNTGGDQNI